MERLRFKAQNEAVAENVNRRDSPFNVKVINTLWCRWRRDPTQNHTDLRTGKLVIRSAAKWQCKIPDLRTMRFAIQRRS